MSGAHSVFHTRIAFWTSDVSIVMWIRRMIDIATSSMWKDNVSKPIRLDRLVLYQKLYVGADLRDVFAHVCAIQRRA